MQDVEKIMKGMPALKSIIQVHGQPVMVVGYKITIDAAYVSYNNGFTDQLIHKDNLIRCANGKEVGEIGKEENNV